MIAKRTSAFETLERRRLMAVHLPSVINDYDLVGDANVQGNGTLNDYIGNTQIPASDNAAGSVFYNTPVAISRFSTGVSLGPASVTADNQYIDFVIQGGPATALGGSGADAGYGGGNMPANSVAVIIDQNGDGTTASMAFATGGVTPTVYTPMPGINLNNSGLYTLNFNYHSGRLNFTITNQGDPTNTFSATKPIDLPTAVGGQTAYIGFAGSSGTQNVNGYQSPFLRQWTYNALEAPTFATPATATLNASSTSALVSGDASLSDNSVVTYRWRTRTKPNGAPDAVFSDPADVSTTATFKKAGTYHLQLVATGDTGISNVSNVSVRVAPVATDIKVSPHAQQIARGSTVDFSATLVDQFGRALAAQPAFTYSVTQGIGQIDATTGIFTAGSKTGHLIISATGDDLTGISGETII